MTQHNEEHEIRVPVPTPPDVHTTVERTEQAIPHVVDHEHRLTSIEHKQEEDVKRLVGEITTTREELFTALNTAKVEQAATLEQKLNELTATLQRVEQATTVDVPESIAEDIDPAISDVVNVVPDVAPSQEPKGYKGQRERRKERHSQK